MARGKPRPGHPPSPALVYALAANGSQTGEGNNQRARSAGPRKRQNRGPGNSTGDGFKTSKPDKGKNS
ncbi:hypothetical protein GAR96_22105 [Salmonella enterica]|nr:hypothetical protein [Salmonella enterica subsp. enterica serovar Kisangani]ECD9411002.1 hypothetical protein [Salmonella enterica subsp. salamae]EDC5554585.1 hypothetical protein [Salmonella enterica]